ncbi:Alpha/Beta hydrolase protein [Armillaria luteobubalina]|uniref:Alpha/Beta hydrolase protein n=1 Tax=Armillaria luteobubalina TaxID=153913 RepID=A0AA39URZ9_9AGAR|nr:Alpha/Beta hydrolase protein [Armillaria luteobubalina]
MASTLTESWIQGPHSTNFFTRYFKADSPTAVIVFVHGFGEHCSRYTDLHSQFAERGVSVFTYDQRGFGRTALDKEHKSKDSSYARTNWVNEMEDVAWAIQRVQKELPGVPVFLMGQSMGGGEVLGFPTEGRASPHASMIASLSGVIATSPMVEQTFPVNKLLRWSLSKLAFLTPYVLFPADLAPDELSRDTSVGAAYVKDPLVKPSGSLLGRGPSESRCHNWPKKLPLIIFHGTDDRITSPKASRAFYDAVGTEDKKYVSYPGAFHELSNETEGGVKDKLLDESVAFIEAHSTPIPETSKL